MRTREIIARIKKYRDYYGFDIVSADEIKTKEQAVEALEAHKRWLEDTLTDALRDVDHFVEKLGIG